jgi:hypothetical protein
MAKMPSERASYGHTGETRSPWPSKSDVGVSAQRSVVDSARRTNSICRKGRNDEVCERALVVMLSLSHWQDLAAHGHRGPDRHKRPRSLLFRDLGLDVRPGSTMFCCSPNVRICCNCADQRVQGGELRA